MPTRIVVELHMESNIDADKSVNTFCHSGLIDVEAEADTVVSALQSFYTGFTGTYMSGDVRQNSHVVKFYDLEAPKPNYPMFEKTFNLTTNPTSLPLPAEVAFCLSFQGPRVSGSPQSRRRGRIYLFPLATGANSSGRPIAAFRTLVQTQTLALAGVLDGLAIFGKWSVWSERDGQAVEITEFWTDDAFDTQRRRGLQPTVKTFFDAP